MVIQVFVKQDEGGNGVVKLLYQFFVCVDQFCMVLLLYIMFECFQCIILIVVQLDFDLLLVDWQLFVFVCMKVVQDGLLFDKCEVVLVIFIENKKVGSGWEKIKKVQYMLMVYGL